MPKTSVPTVIPRKSLVPLKAFHSMPSVHKAITAPQWSAVRAFNQEISEGKWEFEAVPCLCGHLQFDLIADFDRYYIAQKTVICTRCGLVQSNPRLTEAEYGRFYGSDAYRQIYDGPDFSATSEHRFTSDYARHILDDIQQVMPITEKTEVFEFGCGGGWNLLPFSEASARVQGMDYSPGLVALGRSRGLDIKVGSLETIEGQYDLIILNHVLEHFTRPVESLRRIVRHLKPGGLIYIGVPNILNFSFVQLQNAHVYYFDPAHFEGVCHAAGLQTLRLGVAQVSHQFGIFRLSENSGQSPAPRQINSYSLMRSVLRGFVFRQRVKALLISMGLYRRTG